MRTAACVLQVIMPVLLATMPVLQVITHVPHPARVLMQTATGLHPSVWVTST